MDTVETRLTSLLTDRFGIPAQDIGAEVTFADLAVDSLIIVELALILRKEFDVDMEDWDLRPEMTIRKAAEFLTAKGAVIA
jgi:acyl carrier protein